MPLPRSLNVTTTTSLAVVDSNQVPDAPIGSSVISPSRLIGAWARTLQAFGSTAAGNGPSASNWPNALNFSYSGGRIGGTVPSVTANIEGDDLYLYDTGKARLTATFLRAAKETGSGTLRSMGERHTQLAINAAFNGGSPKPLGKDQGATCRCRTALVAGAPSAAIALPSPYPAMRNVPAG